jgi:hypothetical protein
LIPAESFPVVVENLAPFAHLTSVVRVPGAALAESIGINLADQPAGGKP